MLTTYLKKILFLTLFWLLVFTPTILLAFPSVYPSGVTIYDPTKAWNGFTVISMSGAPGVDSSTYLIDMNGNEVKRWKNVEGCWSSKILPGGHIMGSSGRLYDQVLEALDLKQVDWNDKEVWKFDKVEQIKVGDKMVWTSRQHHDYQREGSPVGYYAPGQEPMVNRGRTLVNSDIIVNNKNVTDKPMMDSRILEVDWHGKILWDWKVTDHWDELGLSEGAKNAYYRNPGPTWRAQLDQYGYVKDVYMNNINWVGPNKWFDAGDKRFDPENIIADIRSLNVMFIISKKTGEIVWRVGPYFNETPALRKIGQIVGLHHAHVIPKGLPGEGNILVFDNGGDAGYGDPNPMSPDGVYNTYRHYSRVLEFNPITLEVIWEYKASPVDFCFFSSRCAGAQRLLNGNTLIAESRVGRVFEVTPKKEIVWEYQRPIKPGGCSIFRPVRCPYEWVPQVPKPVEKAVVPPDIKDFKLSSK